MLRKMATTIYYPYPATRFVPEIPDDGYQVVSIDPGIKNFAMRVEKRYRDGRVETLYMAKTTFAGKGGITPEVLHQSLELLKTHMALLEQSHVVVIERQMGINHRVSHLFQHLLTFFLVHAPLFRHPCVVMSVSPKLKGQALGAPKGLKYKELKSWSVAKARELLTARGDRHGLDLLKKGKVDDLADTIVQAEALFV